MQIASSGPGHNCFFFLISGSKWRVWSTDCFCKRISYEHYTMITSCQYLNFLVYSHTFCYFILIFVYACIKLKQAFPGMAHRLHWKVHLLIILFRLSLIQNHLRNANVPSFYFILGSVHGIPVEATTQGCYIKFNSS